MSTWSEMNAAERNHVIGELMKAKPLSQCYLAVDGKRLLVTPYTEDQAGKVEAMLMALRASNDLWADFKRGHSDATDEWREKLTVEIERWHMRYSDTPGGAWCVVEHLHEPGTRGVGIAVLPCGRVHVRVFNRFDADPEMDPRCEEHGATLPEAICRLLLKLKAPEMLA